MSQNPRDQLLQLIEDLHLSMTPEEAKEYMEHLSDEEVQLLMDLYQGVKNEEDEIAEAAYEANPEEFAKLETEYESRVAKLKKELDRNLEKIDMEEAHELDKLDLEIKHDLKDLLHKQQLEMNELDEEHKEIYSKLSSTLLKQSAPPPESPPASTTPQDT